ncbi:hypothetical protein CALVIDRAFT_528063 [Calocera viscosa TUFC12733]|uniref:Uncharacterized protein n=1 Tax=Calocera viscosa (strain TUFC12733) TaxID=1330018 RepID=A0A167LFB1_CALVF|nr:hypothetical protein CALVIDRAFT_528063 [Calocera viscosa TUFC12733]
MYFQNVQRNEEAIVVYLTRNDAMPPCPPELRSHVSEGDWSYRLSAVNRIVKRSSMPLFERIWFGVALLVTFVAPILIYHFIFNAFAANQNITIAAKVAELHAIGFGIFVGICFLFWTPLAIWKGIASMRVRKLMNGFEREDAARQPNAADRPHWKVHLPGVFGTQTRVTISLPPPRLITSFDPLADLPPYIAAYPGPPYVEAIDVKGAVEVHAWGYGDVKDPLPFDDDRTANPRDFDQVDLDAARV